MWVARAVRKQATPEGLARLLARLEPDLKAAILAALDRLRGTLPVRTLEEAIRSGVPARVESVIDWETLGLALLDELDEPMRRALLRGARIALEDLPGRTALTFETDAPLVRAWIGQHGAELVREIDRNTREGLRAILVEMFAREKPIGTAAKEIRTILGLTRRQAEAVQNFRRGLEASMRGERSLRQVRDQYRLSRDVRFPAEGLTPATVDRLTEDYAARWRAHRAQVVAEHEAMAALSEGRRQGWLQAVREGALDPDKDVQVWLTTPDERACPVCIPMHNQRTLLTGRFTTGEGTEILAPPAHVACRCDVVIALNGRLPVTEARRRTDRRIRELARDLERPAPFA